MKLNVLERIVTLQLLPQEGSYATLKIVFECKQALAITEKEYKEFEIVEDKETGVHWNENGVKEIEIGLGEKATKIIVEALKDVDKQGKLTAQNVSLYEKFVVKPKAKKPKEKHS